MAMSDKGKAVAREAGHRIVKWAWWYYPVLRDFLTPTAVYEEVVRKLSCCAHDHTDEYRRRLTAQNDADKWKNMFEQAFSGGLALQEMVACLQDELRSAEQENMRLRGYT